jgi:hypothetical protein
MAAADLSEVRRSFSMLSTDGLRSAYADALERCMLDKRGLMAEVRAHSGADAGVKGVEA